LLSAREVTLHLQGRRNDQAADLEALAQLADKLDDNRLRADAAYRKCRRAMRLADWAAMESSAHYGMACATLAEDTRRRLQALSFVAFGRVQRGDPEAGRMMSLQHLAEARNLTLGDVEGRLLTTLSTAAFMQGDLLGALELNRQGLQAFRESGDRIGEAISLANYGDGWLKLGELEQARRDLNAALHLLRANGDRAIEAATLGQLSTLRLWQGDDTAALSLARSALDLAVAARAPDVEVNAGLKLGDAEVALGRLGAARQAYTQARTRAKEIGSPWQLDASAGVARVALAEGDAQGSVAALQPILEHVESGGTLDGTEYPRLVQLTCHQTLGRASDPRATHWLASAHTALMVQADAITDAAVRRSFLQDIPWHREIVMAWAMCNASSQAPAEPTG
jgi:tetratricopeptide (TPR) repeat protein